MKKKIIAIDLDGTLLNNDSQLSDYTISTINNVSQAGHTVLIATGLHYRMAEKF
ncbi:HAD hydrolase family protein, partial [Streptococcus suis]|uniref:HAD hydrolase family protein n=1 Tax=Streptococcus suis TaxID=1307 RepID=UPI002117D75A